MSSLKDKTVTMAHGAGGRQTSALIDLDVGAEASIGAKCCQPGFDSR